MKLAIIALALLIATVAMGSAHLGKHVHEISDPTMPWPDARFRAWIYEDGVLCGFAYQRRPNGDFVAYYHYIDGEDIPDTRSHYFATEREARAYIERRCK